MMEKSNMRHKYSIVIPYKNREVHLQKILPRLIEKFKGKEYEIVIVEQCDDGPFKKTILMNVAAKYATGDILIFQDVDYFPLDDVSYDYDENVVIYPVRKVMFLDENDKELSDDRIPGGYVNFKYDVGNHSGGVIIISKENFYKINGFNSYYNGWGAEDSDLLKRIDFHNILRRRNEHGTFLSLYHKDSAPPLNDKNFINNTNLLNNFIDTYWMGYTHAHADVTEHSMEDMPNCRWLKLTNCNAQHKLVSILIPTRNRVKSLERTLKSIENTVANKSDIEVIVHIDDDDIETIAYIKHLKMQIEIIPHISKRNPNGYGGIVFYYNEMAKIAKGKLILILADDGVFTTNNWDLLVQPYQNKCGIVYPKDDENGAYGIFWFTTIKMFRIMQTYGSHSYIDRWINALIEAQPDLYLGTIDTLVKHIKDNPTRINCDVNKTSIEPILTSKQKKEWQDISNRIHTYLSNTQKDRK